MTRIQPVLTLAEAALVDRESEVPEGQRYKRFSGMTGCGEGDLVRPSCCLFRAKRKGRLLKTASHTNDSGLRPQG